MANIITFSSANLAAIEAGDKRTYYRDGKVTGLVLSVTPAGVKSFQLVRRFQRANAVRITLGRFDPEIEDRATMDAKFDPLEYIKGRPRLNVRQARTLAVAVIAAMDRGENPVEDNRKRMDAARRELTLSTAFQLYHSEHLIPAGRRKADEMVHMFNRLLGNVPPAERKFRGQVRRKTPGAPDWSKRKLSDISRDDVRQAMTQIRAAGNSVYPANMALILLRACLRKMIADGRFAGPDPTVGVKKFDEVSRDRFIGGDEAPRFFSALEKQPEWMRHLVTLALATGARRGNLMSMRWQDLDLHLGLWAIPAAESKNGRAMSIPLTGLALEVLRQRQGNGSVYVFPAESTAGHLTAIKRPWTNLLADAGIENLRFHDLRRSLGSWAAIGGASLHIIGAALGHRSTDSTQIYARLTVDPVRAAMEKATAALFDAGGVRRE